MAGIEVDGVVKAFGATRVLRSVSLAVAEGEFVSLVGPSGCGKTTLLRIVAGLETADAGRVAIGGRDVTGLRAADRDVAMVFQNYALYPHLTALQNIAVPLVMRRLGTVERWPLAGLFSAATRAKRAAIQADARRVAELLAIGGLLDRKPAQLSGGQRQRVALGRAIVRDPKAFLMDEPLSNLDAALRVTTRAEIVALHRRIGASTVYVTHDQSEAMTMSDRIAVMLDGDIVQVGTPEAIYADPQDLRVAAFIGSPAINRLAAEAGEDGIVRVAGSATGLVTAARGPLVLAVRPEDVAIAGTGLGARVEHLEFLGESLLVHARTTESGEALVARLPPEARRGIALGDVLRLAIDPARALLFGADSRRIAAGAERRERVHG
jgi:multiple sugar transport system ATP-binding protein